MKGGKEERDLEGGYASVGIETAKDYKTPLYGSMGERVAVVIAEAR